MRRFVTCLFLLISLPVFGEEEMQICWVRQVAILPSGEAEITLDKVARGYEVILMPGVAEPRPAINLTPEDTGKNGSRMTIMLPKERWVIVRTTHDQCEFRRERQGELEGIKVKAINTYFMHGGKPTIATVFLPFKKQPSPT